MCTGRDDHLRSHGALLYRDADEFVASVGAFVRDGLAKGEHVIAALAEDRLAWLREALDDADAIEAIPSDPLYARTGRMFHSVLELIGRRANARTRVRLVAERPWDARDDAPRTRAYLRYEAASNAAYPRFAASVLCPYDATALPDEVVQAVWRTHPEVLDGGAPRASEAYEDPRRFVARYVAPAVTPPDATSHPLDAPEDVGRTRHAVQAEALRAGLDPDAAGDLATAASEIAANALLHGAGPRSLTTYVEDGNVVCRVSDGGDGPADPLAGYLPPDPEIPGGRGLWLAHQLCDVAEVATGPAGTDVLLYMRRPAPGGDGG